ncbi:centrosomal protein of 97 kDa [Anabrus simplex]|uniref:centrosomal protein of 97 kDa n=1 Tax=Anabrus simplex TaxID=316456 RepID=UPI0034DD684D
MAETDQQDRILDLSGQGLKKFNKVQPQDIQGVTTLIIDGNELQRWDNIDGYSGLKKLSASHNQLLRMYGVSRLQHLCSLNLAHNSILTIEGLKDLVHLKWLCLAANNIKTIEHLHTNIHLEHLDLSENSITHVSDISFLKNLKQLFLHGNRISQLRQCERYLPSGLVTLTLASNNICDLNEISHLVHLVNLREFSIMGNPCVNMTGNCVGFDYRPFVINWCMSLKVIDGFMVDAIESLKAEWLYSQGRGRQFRVGEHAALVQYLATVCPLSSDTLESEDERKLRLILSKAQQHQQQLREQVTTTGSIRGRGAMLNRSQSSPAPSPAARRRVSSHRHTSPRRGNVLKESKLPTTERHDRGKSPDRMAASCQLPPEGEVNVPVLMTQSLDPCLLFSNSTSDTSGIGDSTDRSSTHLGVDEANSELSNSCPLQAASKLVPVPESLMSPDYRPVQPVVTRMVRPRASTVSTANGPALRGNGNAQGSPKLCRSLHSSPRSRTRSMVEPRRVASTRGPSDHRPQRKRYGPPGTRDGNSSDEDSEMSASKLETIRHRAQERWQRKDTVPVSATSLPAISTGDFQYEDLERAEQAAVCIQKMWRGYYTRNINPEVQSVYRQILDMRTQQYIRKLSADMEATKAALETDRRLHALKMQAINAIWKKVLSIQSQANATQEAASCSSQKSESEAIRELTQTCSLLHSQVEQLQGSMQSILQCLSMLCPMQANRQPCVMGTQTDIVAVNTPLEESFPFPNQRGARTRPSSLPIPQRAPDPVKQFATSLVDGVLRTVAGDSEPAGGILTSDGDTTAPTLEEIVNGCPTSTEQDGILGSESCDIENINTLDSIQEASGNVVQDMTKSILSLDENSSGIIICKEPPSPAASSCELDSPNNNQHARPTDVAVVENGV